MKFARILVLAGLMIPCFAHAQAWPARPIHVVVPFSAGGSADMLARIISAKLGERLGQSVVVDNKVGAGGTIGTDYAAKAQPDGYTLVVGSSSTISIAPYVYGKLPYQPLNDLVPIQLLGTADVLVVANPNRVQARTISDLVAHARTNPGKLMFASGGVGTISHLLGEYFKATAKIDMLHVPYKGDHEALTDLIAGREDLAFGVSVAFLPQLKTGQLVALAVTNPKRSPSMPDLPTVSESGLPGYAAVQWFALFAPAGTPASITNRLNVELKAILAMPEIKSRFAQLGLDPTSETSSELKGFLQAEDKKWKGIVATAGVKLD